MGGAQRDKGGGGRSSQILIEDDQDLVTLDDCLITGAKFILDDLVIEESPSVICGWVSA